MHGHRQSALLLHGLSEPDRHWILERLSGQDQRIVNEYLAELNSLGIPADPTLSASRRPQPSTATPDTLETASPAQMQCLLAGEPVWLIQHLLALGNWPWRDAFLAALPDGQRERIKAAPGAPLPAHAARRLLAHAAQRLARQRDMTPPGSGAGTAENGAIHALRQALRRWR